MRATFSVLAVLLVAAGAAAAQDISGSADHPLVPRYEGSAIVAFEALEYADHRMLVAPATASGGLDANLDASLPLEGRLTRITYRAPEGRSVLEVYRNYEAALAAAGFATVFACERQECGGRAFNHAAAPRHQYMAFGEYHDDQRYLAARMPRAEGDVFAALYVVMNRAGGGPNMGRTMMQLDVVELQPMEERMVVAAAPEMQRDIATEGRVAVYGILFDFDSAAFREESRPQLDEIARLLTDAPQLNVLIVGHTDGQGPVDYNLGLSERRARAVVDTLAADYGIGGERLVPVGVGMAAPVATNRSEEGRALNRRVELVER